MTERVPYFVDTKARMRGAQLFFVDPNVTNEGLIPAVPGSIVNYEYRLPFLQHNFPVRRIRMLQPTDLVVDPPLTFGSDMLLTLRKADGTYLLADVPLSEFITDDAIFPNQRPLIFGDDFFPDPSMSYLKFLDQGQTARVALEFHYG